MTRGILPAGAQPVTEVEIESIAQMAAALDVTEAGARLLAVQMRPNSSSLSMREQCGLADISQDTYYRLQRDDRYCKALVLLNQGLIRAGTLDATRALVTRAAAGDPTCIKMLHEEAGLLQHVQTVRQEHDVGPNLLSLYHARQKAIE